MWHMAEEEPVSLKLFVLGDPGVGKSCIVSRLVTSEFASRYCESIGASVSHETLWIDTNPVKLELWETSDDERFQSSGLSLYHGSDCCVLVYDVTDQASFDAITRWKDQFMEVLHVDGAGDFPFLLLGNKADLDHRVVQVSAGRQYSETENMLFYEVSAKTGNNLLAAITDIARKALHMKKGHPPATT